MKLGRVTNNDPVERLNVGIHASVMANLKAYQELYKQVHTDEIATGHLVESILTQFFDSDRDFQKFLESRKKAGQPAVAGK